VENQICFGIEKVDISGVKTQYM